uniref:Uncharacterized protein n=1 Tax=Anopheles albimanus TaxID=7167 RepID=A0A182FHQ1_ANOAL
MIARTEDRGDIATRSTRDILDNNRRRLSKSCEDILFRQLRQDSSPYIEDTKRATQHDIASDGAAHGICPGNRLKIIQSHDSGCFTLSPASSPCPTIDSTTNLNSPIPSEIYENTSLSGSSIGSQRQGKRRSWHIMPNKTVGPQVSLLECPQGHTRDDGLYDVEPCVIVPSNAALSALATRAILRIKPAASAVRPVANFYTVPLEHQHLFKCSQFAAHSAESSTCSQVSNTSRGLSISTSHIDHAP